MKKKLKALKQTKAQKLYHKTPKLINARDGEILAVYRHRDKQIIKVGDHLINYKEEQWITSIKCDTHASGNMYVTTNLGTGYAGIAAINIKPKIIIV